jgi:hypothetical protein
MPEQLARVMSKRSWQELIAPINAACSKRNRTAMAAQLAAAIVLVAMLSTLALSVYAVVSPEMEYSHLATLAVWLLGIVSVPLINCWVAKAAGDVVAEVRDLLGKRCAPAQPRAQRLSATEPRPRPSRQVVRRRHADAERAEPLVPPARGGAPRRPCPARCELLLLRVVVAAVVVVVGGVVMAGCCVRAQRVAARAQIHNMPLGKRGRLVRNALYFIEVGIGQGGGGAPGTPEKDNLLTKEGVDRLEELKQSGGIDKHEYKRRQSAVLAMI